MKLSFFLAAAALLAAAPTQGERIKPDGLIPKSVTVSSLPSHTSDEWEEILASQDLKEEVCVGCKPGTTPQDPQAGRVSKQNGSLRIIHGDIAQDGDFPWQVSMTMDDSYLCGGSLISHTYILTAGHCVIGISRFQLRLGDTSLFDFPSPTRIVVISDKSILHEGYDPKTVANDIGLVIALYPIPSNQAISPIKLPSHADTTNTFEGMSATVIGFGKTATSVTPHAYVLRQVSQPIMPNKRCARYFGALVRDSNICGDGINNVGACQGDSGNSLAIQSSDGMWKQIGIVSYGSGAGCVYRQPSVYTRVTSFLKWIEDKTGIKL